MNRRLNVSLFKLALEEDKNEQEAADEAAAAAAAAKAAEEAQAAADAAAAAGADVKPEGEEVAAPAADAVVAEVPADAAPAADAVIDAVPAADGAVAADVPAADATPADAAAAEEPVVAAAADATPADAAPLEVVADVPAADAAVVAAAADAVAPNVADEVVVVEPVAAVDGAAADVAPAAAAEPTPVEVVIEAPVGVTIERVEVQVVISDEEVTALDTAGDEADVLLNEGDDAVETSDAILDEVAEVEEAVTALEQFYEVVQLSASRGGLSLESAAILNVGVNSVFDRIGYRDGRVLPAMESFTQKGPARMGGTTIALEELSDTIKKIVAKIIESIKAAAAYVIDFGKRLLDSNARMEANAKKLIEIGKKINTTSGEAVGDAALVKALAKGAGASKSLVADLVAINGFARSAVDGRAVASLQDYNAALQKAVMGSSDAADMSVKAVSLVIGKGMKPATQKAGALGLEEAPEGTKLYTSPVFLGNNFLWAYMPTGPEAVDKIRIGTASVDVQINSSAKLGALSGGDIVAVGESVLEFTKSFADYRKTEAAVKAVVMSAANAQSSMATGIRAAQKYESGGKSAAAGEVLSSVPTMLRAARALIKGVHQPAFAVAARANHAALRYAMLSAQAHSGKKPAAAAQPKLAAA